MTAQDPPGAAGGEIARELASIRQGDPDALGRLFPLVYRELRASAHRQLAAIRPGDTLNTTALVHEAYLKLDGASQRDWVDRRHFLAVAARAMRQIAVDYARAQSAQKRGGPAPVLTLEEGDALVTGRPDELVALDEALTRLEAVNPRGGRIVELRFFVGLSVEETAEATDLSPRTVKREWRKARAFLLADLGQQEVGP